MKIKTLLIFINVVFAVQLNGTPLDSIQEFLSFENPEYIGYRIALTDLSVTTSKNDMLKIEFTPINTGRKDLLFGKNITPPPSLVVIFDESIYKSSLTPYAEEIRAAIQDHDFHISSGKIYKKISIKLPIKAQDKDQKDERVTDILENPRLAKPIDKNKEPENFTKKGVNSDDFENTLAASSFNYTHQDYDENACADLVFESIKVIKKSKSKVTIEYTIVNLGEGPATIINSRKNEEKNMALKAHFSSRDKLTKGSLTFGGDFVQKGLDHSKGKLYPGQKYTGTIKLNIQKMTKFTPYIILELDPYLSVFECDKKNNKVGVKVGEGI